MSIGFRFIVQVVKQSRREALTNVNELIKFNMAYVISFIFEIVENIVEKGESAGYQHFLLFPKCFQKATFLRVIKKVPIVW